MAPKKFISWFLLCFYVAFLGGQLLSYHFAVYQTNKFYNRQASFNLYDPHELTEIKIPVDMPRITDWPAYEPISGSIKFDNAIYNYVKMRITRHAMYLICIPAYESGHLNGYNALYAKGIKDIPVPKKHRPITTKLFSLQKFEYADYAFEFTIHPTEITTQLPQPVQSYTGCFTALPDQPPRAC